MNYIKNVKSVQYLGLYFIYADLQQLKVAKVYNVKVA